MQCTFFRDKPPALGQRNTCWRLGLPGPALLHQLPTAFLPTARSTQSPAGHQGASLGPGGIPWADMSITPGMDEEVGRQVASM